MVFPPPDPGTCQTGQPLTETDRPRPPTGTTDRDHRTKRTKEPLIHAFPLGTNRRRYLPISGQLHRLCRRRAGGRRAGQRRHRRGRGPPRRDRGRQAGDGPAHPPLPRPHGRRHQVAREGGPDTRPVLGPGVSRRPGTALPRTAALELLRQPVGPLLARPARAGRRLADGLRDAGHRGAVVGGRAHARHDQRREQLRRDHRRKAHRIRRRSDLRDREDDPPGAPAVQLQRLHRRVEPVPRRQPAARGRGGPAAPEPGGPGGRPGRRHRGLQGEPEAPRGDPARRRRTDGGRRTRTISKRSCPTCTARSTPARRPISCSATRARSCPSTTATT